MTDTHQLPSLPTLQPGDSHMESLIEAAIQGHADTREAMRWLVRQLVPATQPSEVTDSMIREAFLTNGFTIKDGHSDLKPYVYAAARALLALQSRSHVQGDPFGYIHHYIAHDEHGAIIDTTWEADGCADALPHPTFPDFWKWSHATPFYTTPQQAQAEKEIP